MQSEHFFCTSLHFVIEKRYTALHSCRNPFALARNVTYSSCCTCAFIRSFNTYNNILACAREAWGVDAPTDGHHGLPRVHQAGCEKNTNKTDRRAWCLFGLICTAAVVSAFLGGIPKQRLPQTSVFGRALQLGTLVGIARILQATSQTFLGIRS